MKAIVLGGGMVGLATAVVLLERGWQVEVVAETFMEGTTSWGAGAIWEHPAYLVGPVERAAAWNARSLAMLTGLSRDPATGVFLQRYTTVFSEPTEPVDNEAELCPDFVHSRALLADAALGPTAATTFRDAWACTVPTVNPPAHMRWTMQRIAARGGSFRQAHVASLDTLREQADVVVNCTGLGASAAAGDSSVRGVQGDLVHVFAPQLTGAYACFWPDAMAYVFPRGDGTAVIGGTAWPPVAGDHRLAPQPCTPADYTAILARCARVVPALASAPILNTWSRYRPVRATVRLEVEAAAATDSCRTPVIHNYGHGGSGIVLSWPCAEEVAHLAAPFLRPRADAPRSRL